MVKGANHIAASPNVPTLEKRMRLDAIFIAVCMVLIAGSAGAVAFLVFAFGVGEAIAVALTLLVVLAVYNTVSARLGVRTVVGNQIGDLSRGTADLARQVGEIGRRQFALEHKFEATVREHAHAVTGDPLAGELGELGALVKELADTVAAHAAVLAEITRPQAEPAAFAAATRARPEPAPALSFPPVPVLQPTPVAPVIELTAAAAPAAALPATAKPADAPTAPPVDQAAREKMLAFIRGAIDANRIDLYLQPIVTLPQRKVRYYEAMSRLRSEHGDVVQAASFIAHAEAAGLMPKIDNLVIFRCVQVVRRLLLKNSEIGLFCNVAGATLTDAAVFQQLLEFIDANRAIAPAVVFEFTQDFLRNAGPIENESLHALRERGFRFSLDNVTDLRLEPRDLAQRGFRFIKVPASLLLDRSGEAASDIHSADLSNLLGRFGIELVAEKIESEGMVVDLLDYEVRYGQGFLFAPPRPVRAEALQGIAERNDVVVRDSATEPMAAARGSDEITATEAAPIRRAGGIAQIARRI